MKFYNLGCSTVKDGYESYTRADYFDILDQYHELGVRFVEYSHPQTMREKDARSIVRYAARLGMKTWSAHAWSWGAQKTEEESLLQLQHDAKIAAILGAQILVFHRVDRLPNGEIHWKAYEQAAQIAEKNGLELAIETGTGGDLPGEKPSYLDIIDLVDQIHLRHVGICIDTGHSFLYDDPKVEKVVEAVGNRLKSVHLHDNGGRQDDHQAPGLGFINWDKVIPALKASSYDGPLMLEMTSTKRGRKIDLLKNMTIDCEILYGDALFRHIWNRW